jgi:hypothetical protein
VPGHAGDENAEIGDDLLDHLGDGQEAVPTEVLAAARAAFDLKQTGSRLLDLVLDSDDGATVAGQSRQDLARQLEFRCDETSVRVTVVPHADHCDVIGVVNGADLAGAQIRTPELAMPCTIEPKGAFSASDVPRGPASVVLEVRDASRRSMHTDWTLL